MENSAILKVENIRTGYGKKLVLDGISLDLMRGEIVALVGRNGSGKSTLLKAIFGLIPLWEGMIIYENKALQRMKPSSRVRIGISFAPQGNRVFTELTVKENLEVGGYILKNKNFFNMQVDEVLLIFPQLKKRLSQNAGSLSGGEQQMLALASALMIEPKVLLLDEPSLGLSPDLVKTTLMKVKEINQKLNTTILIVEQKVREVLYISDRVYVMKLGKFSFEGKPQELLKEDKIQKVFM